MSPRRDRWLSFSEIGELMVKHRPVLANLSKADRRQYVRRVVKRAERRDEVRYTKRVGRALFVSRNALEHLLPYNGETISELERGQAAIRQNQALQERQLNGHGSRLREHSKRLSVLEEKQAALLAYLTTIDRIERAANETGPSHEPQLIRRRARTGAPDDSVARTNPRR